MRRKAKSELLGLVGLWLSPITPWNDAFCNIPIAWAIASLVTVFCKDCYQSSFIGAYIMTNIAGFSLMRLSAFKLSGRQPKKIGLLIDIAISMIYVGIIWLGTKLGWPAIQELFP